MTQTIIAALAACITLGPTASAQGRYPREIPDSLARHAKVAESDAAATALKRMPSGIIQHAELERESGKLVYAFDIKVPGKSGVDEVGVDAVSGKIVFVEHETPAQEKKEAAADAKAASKSAAAKP